jgi:nucleoside-diphosphate kinase
MRHKIKLDFIMTERTFSFIKPDAFAKKDDIVKMIKNAKFKVVKDKKMHFTKELAEEFYAEHKGKPWFPDHLKFITSGDVFAMILEKENAIKDFRAFIGATDSKKAEPGTVRQKFGTDIMHNAIHGSDSQASYEREIKLIFK